MSKELTGPQIPGGTGLRYLTIYQGSAFHVNPISGRATYATYREIRKHPTIHLVRTIMTAAIVAAGWTVKRKDNATDELVRFAQDEMLGIQPDLCERAVEGGIDFGFSPFEKVYANDAQGRIVIDKLKPLLQDITIILSDNRGNFAGFKQPTQGNVVVPRSRALLYSWRVEGTNLYGEPLLEIARTARTSWETADDAQDTWDEKVVGTRLVVYYPRGESEVDGETKDNADIAQDIIDELDTAGSAAVPVAALDYVANLNAQHRGWKIEELGGKGQTTAIVDRQRYLDILMVRAMGFPERTVIEGATEGSNVGTETAQKWAIQKLDGMARYVATHTSREVLDDLIEWNFGREYRGAVYLLPNPIADESYEALTEVVKEIVKTNPQVLDVDTALDHVGFPKSGETVKPVEPEPVEVVT